MNSSRPSPVDRVQKHIATLEAKIAALVEENKVLREKVKELKSSKTRLPRIPKPAPAAETA
jgi:cell division protein FtsB